MRYAWLVVAVLTSGCVFDDDDKQDDVIDPDPQPEPEPEPEPIQLNPRVAGGVDHQVEPLVVVERVKFATTPDWAIDRLAEAASGLEAAEVERKIRFFEDQPTPDPCPAITVDPVAKTVTIVGNNCQRGGADQTFVRGTAIIHNPKTWGDFVGDPTLPTRYELDAFELEQYTFVENFDGTLVRSASGLEDEIDLDVMKLGTTVHAHVRMTCTMQTCTHADSLVSIGGVIADVVGTQASPGRAQNTKLDLVGLDTLSYEAAAGCTSWTISDSDRYRTACP